MAISHYLAACLALLCASISVVVADNSFENTAIVRTVELGGSNVHVRRTFVAKALETGSMVYAFALGHDEAEKTSFYEARLKGDSEPLELQHFGLNAPSNTYLYAAVLPKGLKKGEEITVELDTVQTHATYPWPASVGQNDLQLLKYDTDMFVISPYTTAVQRTKIRSSTPRIKSYTEPIDVDAFTMDTPVTKSGATITYGPFNNVPASANAVFKSTQQRVTVHYEHDTPVMQITSLKRAAEISHWGSNLNIQDDIWLHNAGPELKGHFSRLEHQVQTYKNAPVGHMLRAVSLYLPPGAHDAYFVDTVGNVSTSAFRPAASVPKGSKAKQSSYLELKPRYPVLGGWNYSFTLGWDSPLRDWTSYGRDGRYTVAVPIFTQFPDTVIEEAEVQIILPEGAIDLLVYPPFSPSSMQKSTHSTYLDTKGRPAVSFFYKNLTDSHVGYIYVSYRVPFPEHMRKPVTISAILFGLFVLSAAFRRVDMSIRSAPAKKN